MTPLFSVCHATARLEGWRAAYDAWWARAGDPNLVEYILVTEPGWGFPDPLPAVNAWSRWVINPHRRCCVDAYNEAARHARGELLIMASDDVTPPDQWDILLREKIGSRIGTEYVVEVTSEPMATQRKLIVVQMLSRARYQRLGYVFWPEYISMYADDEFGLHARRDKCVIDATDLLFAHDHPRYGNTKWDAVYAHENKREAYAVGAWVYNGRALHGFPGLETLRSVETGVGNSTSQASGPPQTAAIGSA